MLKFFFSMKHTDSYDTSLQKRKWLKVRVTIIDIGTFWEWTDLLLIMPEEQTQTMVSVMWVSVLKIL